MALIIKAQERYMVLMFHNKICLESQRRRGDIYIILLNNRAEGICIL